MASLMEVKMLNVSIFGGSDLGKHSWKPGKKLWAITLLGGTDIIVPPDLPVTVSGFSLFGGRDVKLSKPGTAEPTSGKSLHVQAFAILGGVDIKPPKEKKP
jgi:hypothetical protein